MEVALSDILYHGSQLPGTQGYQHLSTLHCLDIRMLDLQDTLDTSIDNLGRLKMSTLPMILILIVIMLIQARPSYQQYLCNTILWIDCECTDSGSEDKERQIATFQLHWNIVSKIEKSKKY